MGTWAIVLSDGQTFGELDGCSVIYIREGLSDYDNYTDDEILDNSALVMGFSVLTDGRLDVEKVNVPHGDTEFVLRLSEPES